MRKSPVLLLVIVLVLFLTNPSATLAYGGYHAGYGYQNYYGGYASYGYDGDGDAAGYFILGVLGVILLSHILNQDDYSPAGNPPVTYNPPPRVPVAYPVYEQKPAQQYYFYGEDEGWNLLAKGNAGHALDIFAIQSQQDLDSGIPRIGFALAAAAIGDPDRGIRAMRKAVSTDPDSLEHIQINNEINAAIDFLNDEYKTALHHDTADADNAFMVAALSYLKQDYTTANAVMNNADHSASANNLRTLLLKYQ